MTKFKKELFLLPVTFILICILNTSLFNLPAIEVISLLSYLLLGWLLGVVAFPVLKLAVPKLGVASYALSKLFGIGFFFYILWLLNHFDTLRGPWTSSALLLISIILFFKYAQEKFSQLVIANAREVLTIELIYFSFFFIVLSIYALHPELFWGEKPMDFTLLNYFSKYPSLPPQDPWLSGELMHYYYWGYFYLAQLGNMAGLNSEVPYGAGLAFSASLFGCALYALFSLVLRSTKYRLGATVALFFSSNLASFFYFLSDGHKPNMQYFWSSTRIFSDGAFAEYPLWSFLFADLHAHVLSYPFSVAFLCLLFYGIDHIWKDFSFKSSKFFLGVYAFSFGFLALLNGWDFVIYSVLASLLWFLQGPTCWKKLSYWMSFLFSHITGLIIVSPFLWSLFGGTKKKLALSHVDFNDFQSLFFFFGGWLVLICLSFIFQSLKKAYGNSLARLARLDFLIATLLIVLIAENIIFMDRINTIFKTYTNVFIWLGFVGLCWSFRYLEEMKKCILKRVFIILVSITLGIQIVGSLFNTFAILNSRAYGNIGTGLKGSAYLKRFNPDDYKVIEWLRKNTVGLPVILEKDSSSFNHNATRISMHTGLPTYLGWHNHVRLRGASDELIGKRRSMISFILNSPDALKVHEQLLKEGIHFVVLGRYERANLSREAMLKFESFSQLFEPLLKVNDRVILFGVGDFRAYLRNDKIKLEDKDE